MPAPQEFLCSFQERFTCRAAEELGLSELLSPPASSLWGWNWIFIHLHSVILGKLQSCLFHRSLAKAVASEAGSGLAVSSSIPTVCSGHSLSSPPSCLSLSPGHTGAVVPCIYPGCALGGIDPFIWLLHRHFFLLSSRNCVWEGAWEATSKGYRRKMRIVGVMSWVWCWINQFVLVPIRNGEFPGCAGECQWSRFSEMPEASRDCRTEETLKPDLLVYLETQIALCGLSCLGMRLGWSRPWMGEGMSSTWRGETRICPARVMSNK